MSKRNVPDTSIVVVRHVERVHLEEVVDAVFKLYTVLARALGCVDERPYFVEVHRKGHLDGDVLAVLHSVHAYGGVVRRWAAMQIPRSDAAGYLWSDAGNRIPNAGIKRRHQTPESSAGKRITIYHP